MAAPTISILSDSSEESVDSHAPRVILFGVIPAIIPIILEVLIIPADPLVALDVGTVLVVLPTGVLDLLDYSSSFDSDPSEDSLSYIPDLALVSPSRSSSHDTFAPSSEFPIAPIVASPRIRRHTTDADSSTPQRFVHQSHARTPRRSEAFRRWRSPTTLVASHTHVSRSIASNSADSFTTDQINYQQEEDAEEFKVEASAADTREIVVDPLAIDDSSESSRGGIPDFEDTIYDIVHYMSEVRIDRITELRRPLRDGVRKG
ncbi:hypothetical protein Tco_0553432 [Tanacetum coccineum]